MGRNFVDDLCLYMRDKGDYIHFRVYNHFSCIVWFVSRYCGSQLSFSFFISMC